MPDAFNPIQRIRDETASIAKQNAHMREVLAKSMELLKISAPDVFLGRKTQEPFPEGGDCFEEA